MKEKERELVEICCPICETKFETIYYIETGCYDDAFCCEECFAKYLKINIIE